MCIYNVLFLCIDMQKCTYIHERVCVGMLLCSFKIISKTFISDLMQPAIWFHSEHVLKIFGVYSDLELFNYSPSNMFSKKIRYNSDLF